MGLAGAHLGWKPAEFWESTPAELWAVFRAYEAMNRPAGG